MVSIAEAASATPGQKYAAYTYLGAGAIVVVDHPAASPTPGTVPGLTLSYGVSGVYPGLDNFGRVVEQKWTVNEEGGWHGPNRTGVVPRPAAMPFIAAGRASRRLRRPGTERPWYVTGHWSPPPSRCAADLPLPGGGV